MFFLFQASKAQQQQQAQQPSSSNIGKGQKGSSSSLKVIPNGGVPVKPKDQLAYLAKVLGLAVNYQDFPNKNSKTEYVSLVSLSTSPPQVK